ncbi:MAG: hypothetical protein LJE91_18295 [Gammaproteobacteria bacterium]|jgi:hypothetical protein|nr:hypothetical protein [Gammaproteobacteria bacterium]
MLHRISTCDPITGQEIDDLEGKPYIVESGSSEDLVIYFESDATKREFMNIPVEHPIDHHVNLDNPTDIMFDEG